MTSVDFVTELFVRVDDAMTDIQKHSQAKLHPSEIATLGVLYAIKGVGERAFYRFAERDLIALFPHLPERTRLFRLLATHQDWTHRFLANSTVLGIIDSYGIELLHPIREREKTLLPRIATKGKSNYRWIMGAKLGLLVNQLGLVVNWTTAKESDHDTVFLPLVSQYKEQSIILADHGFHRRSGDPANLKICKKGTWNDRMLIETVLSMLTSVCHLKKLAHRSWQGLQARLAFVTAAYNLLVQWHGLRPDQNQIIRLSIAEFSL